MTVCRWFAFFVCAVTRIWFQHSAHFSVKFNISIWWRFHSKEFFNFIINACFITYWLEKCRDFFCCCCYGSWIVDVVFAQSLQCNPIFEIHSKKVSGFYSVERWRNLHPCWPPFHHKSVNINSINLLLAKYIVFEPICSRPSCLNCNFTH